MAALSPKNLGLDEDSHETAELRRFLGSEPWTVAQLTEALASSNCLGLTDPAPSSPANLLSGFIADLKYPGYPDFENSKKNMLLHLDDLILQIRLRFRMAPPQSLDNAIGDIDFLLSLVQELGSKILYERKAHAEAIARVKQDLEVTARKRPIFTGGESTVSSPVGSRVSTVAAGVDDQISAIRRTQEERRARLSSAIAQLKNEVQGVKDREQQLSEENELLIRSTAQQEQALEEYRFESEAPSGNLLGFAAEIGNLRRGRNPDTNSPGALAVNKALARSKAMKYNTKPKPGIGMRDTHLTRMRCSMREVWDTGANECA